MRDIDNNKYSEGGIARCEQDRAKQTLDACQTFYKQNPSHHYFQASQRLEILLSGTSYDIFSQDVYYHHSCYRRFTRMAKSGKENDYDNVTQKKHDAMQGFLYKTRVTIVRDKYAFLLNELLKKNVIAITDEHRLSEPVIDYTTSLMGKLMGEFHDEISFSLKTN